MGLNPPLPSRRRAAFAASVGNVIEWYDWSIYALFAFAFAGQFFPKDNEAVALVSTFAVFAIGFLARPLGSITLGRLTDRMGRRTTLTLTVSIMAVASVLIAAAPTAGAIGAWAAIWLVVLRFVQGLALGAETGAIGAFLVESARGKRRGLMVSTYAATGSLGTLVGSAVALLLAAILSDAQMAAFGWRIPFVIGGLLGLFAIYVRRNTTETLPASHIAEPRPLRNIWHTRQVLLWQTVILGGAQALTFFTLLTGFPALVQLLGASDTTAHGANTVGLVAMVVGVPMFGMLSDRVGRRPVLVGAFVGMAVVTLPITWLLLDATTEWKVYLAQILVIAPLAAMAGATLVSLLERYPMALRGVGFGFLWALAMAAFGGTGPMLATWLIGLGNKYVLSTYFIVVMLVAAALALRMQESAFDPERKD